MAAPSMDRLAAERGKRDGGSGVGSIFVYTNEAHPGEHYPHLESMAQKRRHGEALREVYGVERPIYLDSLDGACHRAYGSMPNMTWILDRRARVLYKADWTDASSVERALDDLLALPARRRAGERLRPFRVEHIAHRHRDGEAFSRGLERAGPKAVAEHAAVFGH